jgi:hypothetical protein
MAEKVKLPVAVICECPVSYHQEWRGDRMVQVLDQELPDIMTMCVGRCERCGLPFHDDFPRED